MDALILRAKARDPQALTEIYERYRAGIYRYIYQKIQDAELADDVTSEVFLRMLEGIERFEDRGWPIGALLYRIARDRTFDLLRRQQRRKTVSLEPWHTLVPGPEEVVLRGMEHDTLRTQIAFLTQDQRQVLELRFWEELDIDTTAVQLGKTRNAVKALQHRAVDTLKRRVSNGLAALSGPSAGA